MEKKKKNNDGFSLVELIVTVLIIAIIASLLTLAVTKYVKKSKVSADLNTAGELSNAAYIVATNAVVKYGSIAECKFVFDTERMELTGDTDYSKSPNKDSLENGDVMN